MAGAYNIDAMSFPAPQLETATAGTIDTEGDVIAARRHQNRSVNLSVAVTGTSQTTLDAAMLALETKVAKMAREGGTLRRVRADGTYRTLDILAADTYEPQFDITYQLGNATLVSVGLMAKPYARGAEVTLTSHSEATLPVLTFTDTVTGDVTATGRLVITEAQAQNQYSVFWGSEGFRYDSSTSLFKQAESSVISPATSVADATASGGNVAQMGGGVTGIDMVRLSNLANKGVFRILVRAKSSTTTAKLQMSTSVGVKQYGSSVTVATPAAVANTWALYELGYVTITDPLISSWTLSLYATTPASQTLSVDWVLLMPVEQGAGEVQALITGGGAIAYYALDASGAVTIRSDGVIKGTSTVTHAPRYEGDYLRLRPGTNRVVVKTARYSGGSPTSPVSGGPYYDAGIDDVSAVLTYTPRFLSMV